MRYLLMACVLVQAMLSDRVVSGQEAPRCKGTMEWHDGVCRYPRDIEESKRRLAPTVGRPAAHPRMQAGQPSAKAGSSSRANPADIKWVRLAGGRFTMGANADQDLLAGVRRPAHAVRVPVFMMARTETTVAQYQMCVRAGACAAPHWDDRTCYVCPARDQSLILSQADAAAALQRMLTGPRPSKCDWECGKCPLPEGFRGPRQPMSCVNWEESRAFCAWAGGRLPSEAEWEYAARSGGLLRDYPWGNTVSGGCALAIEPDLVTPPGGVGAGCGRGTTWPVCSVPRGNSLHGLCDLIGNVWEWVEDAFHRDYRGAPADGSAWTDGLGASHVMRGGSFHGTQTATYRFAWESGDSSYDLGFRCAADY